MVLIFVDLWVSYDASRRTKHYSSRVKAGQSSGGQRVALDLFQDLLLALARLGDHLRVQGVEREVVVVRPMARGWIGTLVAVRGLVRRGPGVFALEDLARFQTRHLRQCLGQAGGLGGDFVDDPVYPGLLGRGIRIVADQGEFLGFLRRPDHSSGGETSLPSPVYLTGIRSPSANALLVTLIVIGFPPFGSAA